MRTLLMILMGVMFLRHANAGDFSITWKGEVRVRAELDGRDFQSATAPNVYTLLRTRFGAQIQPSENVQVFLQLQDSRVFGEEKNTLGFNTTADVHNVDLHQGYIKVKNLFADGLSVMVGRMELSYGEERIIGALNWSNVGRAFDAALLKYETQTAWVDLFLANTGETSTPPSAATPAAVAAVRDSGQMFSGLYISLKSLDRHTFDGYLLHQWDRRQTVTGKADLSRFTTGVRAKGSVEDVKYGTELAYQSGTTKGTDIQAFMLVGQIGYAIDNSLLTSVAVEYDYLSGSPLASTKYKSFDPVFHTGHKFYGFMDYFINIPSNTNGRGLQDMFMTISIAPCTDVNATVAVHNLRLAEAWSGNKDLGQEIDFTGVYKHSEPLTFELGVSGFVPGTVMRAWFNGSDVSLWGYLTTRVGF